MPDEIRSFEQLLARFQSLFNEGHYEEAKNLTVRYFDQYPKQHALIYYWRISIYAQQGDTDAAIQVLQNALEAGYWYSEILLRKSPAVESLQGIPQYETLFERNQQLFNADKERTYQLITIRPEGGCTYEDPPCPLLMAFHNNQSSAQDSIELWQPVASQGWLLAVPQSSHVLCKNAYYWDNIQKDKDEIQSYYQSLFSQYNIDEERIILSGQSLGAEIAIWLSLTQTIPSTGFIALEPSNNLLESILQINLQDNFEDSHGIKAYFILRDQIKSQYLPQYQALFNFLNASNVSINLEVISKTSEEFDSETRFALSNAIEFLTKN